MMKHLRQLAALVAVIASSHAVAQTPDDWPGVSGRPLLSAAQRGSFSEANAAVFKACAAAPKARGACPLDAVFGLFKLAPDNDVLDFKASLSVPRVVGQNYGWAMKLSKMTGKVRVLERLTLPEAPASWGAGGDAYGTSADRKSISLDVTLTVHDGVVSKSWDVAEGDPAGHYVISAYIENSAPVRFEFDVGDPAQ